MTNLTLPDFLPGTFAIDRGTVRDYDALADFHYVARRPATLAGVWVVRFTDRRARRRVAAVGVLSHPVPSCASRERFLGLTGSRSENLRFANAYIRTISRIVVHPQFRSLGLSTRLVHWICNHCDTRYVEAMARMARVHPLFDRAGMTRVEPLDPGGPVYFIFDREAQS
jgi:ABC-type ATPase with predicted acetyltransferase domain